MEAQTAGIDYSVSVITPAYNCEKFIRQTVDCVANQTVKVKEHIIINDGSSDNTLAILQQLQKQYPHLLVLDQPNSGAAAARNLGIEHASARYIAFLDSDDNWAANKLEQQISFMEAQQVLFSYGDYEEIDEDSGTVLHRYQLPDALTYRQLLNGCPIGCLTVAFNQEKLGKKYMPKIRRGQDWALWLAITRDGVTAQKYSGCLAQYRVVKSSLSKNKFKKLFDLLQIYRTEQQLGWPATLWHLCRHAWYVSRKRS